MTEPGEKEEIVPKIPEEKVEEDVMVEFLTSRGTIGNTLAVKLYKGGLENWALLVNGDEEYFMSLKGVGKKTSANLIELGEIKKKEIEESSKVPTLEEVLKSVPRVSDKVVDLLKENGYDSFSSYKDLEPEKLQELKGIGPKLSISIVENVHSAMEKYGIDEKSETPIEDATGIEMEETAQEKDDKEERGFFEKLMDGIKNLFGGKKEEKPKEEEEEGAEAEEEKEDEKIEEPPKEEEKEEEPPEDEKKDEKVEEPPEQEEKKEEEAEEKVEETEETPVEEGPKEEKGIFQKIKDMIFGGKDETATKEGGSPEQETPEEEGEKEEEDTPDEEETGEEKGEEPAKEEDDAPEEEKVKEAPKKKDHGPLGLKGVSKKLQEKLMESGYMNVDELKEAVPEDLTMIDGIDEKTAKRICNAAKK